MKTEKLDYELPTELIAQRPAEVRSESRLLVLKRSTGEVADRQFSEIGEFLRSGDCLVLNDTKVLAARFFAQRASGGKLEGLFLSEKDSGVWEVMLKGARKVKYGEVISLKDKAKGDFCTAEVVERLGQGRFGLKLVGDQRAATVLDQVGYAPLPPYIKRGDDTAVAAVDKVRYQTVYARNAGAVAAPTAGLHFTRELIGELEQRGVVFAFVTLHVGAGTFKPVTVENLENHEIHEENYSIDEETAAVINGAKAKGGRIIAVGTTSARVLETVAEGGEVKASSGTTNLFIMPGYEFKAVDALITNFHLPKSTLLALVAGLAGLENILAAYRHAVEKRYRFYSYGDAMLIV